MTSFQTDQCRWAALQSRNPLASSAFVYCVLTTRNVCRPNCSARLARRSNVIFHDSYADAAAAGFRACKRCRPEHVGPDERRAELVESACSAIADGVMVSGGKGVGLDELARAAGLTRSHFHRVFKSVVGFTPGAYAGRLRSERVLASVVESEGMRVGGSDEMAAPVLMDVGDLGLVGEAMSVDFQTVDGVNGDSGKGVDSMGHSLGALPPDGKNAFTKRIEHTIQPWASGFVLIAATEDGICWLEAGNSVLELSTSLAHEFPLADLEQSHWPANAEAKKIQDGKHIIFAMVMEALVNPTGKVVDIPFDVVLV